MSLTANDLAKDPVFQLNLVLWLVQPSPQTSDIVPLFHRKGFTVYLIAPLLGVPLDLRLVAQQGSLLVQEAVRPDVVLVHDINRQFAFTECKASSFGTASSTAQQARSLLLIAGPSAPDALGLPREKVSHSILSYLIPEGERNLLTQTLAELQEKLTNARMSCGTFSVIGLVMTDTDVSIVIDQLGSRFFGLPEGNNQIMNCDPGTDPRPLYFIPYDPDIDQSEQEKIFCRRILFERIQGTVISAMGRASVPTQLILESQKILNDAMFGMYGLWDNRESHRHMHRLCRQFMDALRQAVNAIAADAITFEPEKGWKIALQSEDQKEKVIDALTRFSCETLDLRKDPQPGLFDDQ